MENVIAPLPMDPHAIDRCNERELPPPAVAVITADKTVGINLSKMDVAVLVHTFTVPRGDRYNETASNGENVWSIVRGGIIDTVFYRRASQPSDKSVFRVDRVIR